jgi:hypothetical protein
VGASFVALVAIAAPAASAAESVTPTADTSHDWVCEGYDEDCSPDESERLLLGYVNYGGRDNLDSTWRAVLHFDLSDIPQDAEISSAGLGLYYDGTCIGNEFVQTSCTGPQTLDAHRATTNAEPPEFNAVPEASVTTTGIPQWVVLDITQLVRDWLSGAASNHGVLVKMPELLEGNGGPYILSQDSSDSSFHPRLTINYVGPPDPPPPVRGLMGGDGANVDGGSSPATSCGRFPTKTWRVETSDPHFVADGGRGEWVLRDMYARDWNRDPWGHGTEGFTAQGLWVGTNGQSSKHSNYFVEVGVTQGYDGKNVYTYYTAAIDGGGGFAEERITDITPTKGTLHRFSVFRRDPALGPGYWAAIDGIGYFLWEDNSGSSNDWSMGYEITCGEAARINRTNVSLNQFRRMSDGVWHDATSAEVESDAGSIGGGFAWCSYPTNFRYYIRSELDPTVCE